jgi:membrane protein involved in colicin uptake
MLGKMQVTWLEAGQRPEVKFIGDVTIEDVIAATRFYIKESYRNHLDEKAKEEVETAKAAIAKKQEEAKVAAIEAAKAEAEAAAKAEAKASEEAEAEAEEALEQADPVALGVSDSGGGVVSASVASGRVRAYSRGI